MKLTADDYRAHYRSLSDEEFLAIDRDDLVDMARRSYDAELAHRQLQPRKAEEDFASSEHERKPALPPIPTDEEMVQVAIIASTAIAQDALKILHEADVPGFLTETPKFTGRYAEDCFGLMVPVSCVDPVRQLLAANLTWNNQDLVCRWFERDWTPEDLEIDEFRVTVEDHFGEENKVAARITVAGVNPDTRNEVQFTGIAIVHLSDGNIGEHWIRLDG